MIYTILLCVLVLLIYLSNRGNKTNRWCAISGFLLSLGALKEYYYFEIVPRIPNAMVNGVPQEIYTSVYSGMTALLYYLAMPAAIVFALYFSGYTGAVGGNSVLRGKPLHWLIFAIPAFMALFYKPHHFREYQISAQYFWYIMGAYNLICGAFFIALILRAVHYERNPEIRRQKRLVSAVILPPIVYWLITIFVIHIFGIEVFFKAWRGNVIIILISLSFFLYMAFKEGIMGLKLRSESYRWDSDMTQVRRSVQFTTHMFKNEAVKMDWCIQNLAREFETLRPDKAYLPEFTIMRQSIEKQMSLLEKMYRYSNEILLSEQSCVLFELMNEAISAVSGVRGEISFFMEIDRDVIIFCDRQHMLEVLNNLLLNAAEAVRGNGRVFLSYFPGVRHGYRLIQVKDNGDGIGKQHFDHIFEPYYTTKRSERNFGLGLSYCRNVIRKHGGYIVAESESGVGTTITVALPASRFSVAKEVQELGEQNTDTIC